MYLKYSSDNEYTVIALRDLNKFLDVKQAPRVIDPDLDHALKN